MENRALSSTEINVAAADELAFRTAQQAVEELRAHMGIIHPDDSLVQQKLTISADTARVDWVYNRGLSEEDVMTAIGIAVQAGAIGVRTVLKHFEDNKTVYLGS